MSDVVARVLPGGILVAPPKEAPQEVPTAQVVEPETLTWEIERFPPTMFPDLSWRSLGRIPGGARAFRVTNLDSTAGHTFDLAYTPSPTSQGKDSFVTLAAFPNERSSLTLPVADIALYARPAVASSGPLVLEVFG